MNLQKLSNFIALISKLWNTLIYFIPSLTFMVVTAGDLLLNFVQSLVVLMRLIFLFFFYYFFWYQNYFQYRLNVSLWDKVWTARIKRICALEIYHRTAITSMHYLLVFQTRIWLRSAGQMAKWKVRGHWKDIHLLIWKVSFVWFFFFFPAKVIGFIMKWRSGCQ